MKLKPWYDVVELREDLRENRPLDASEFAIHLDQIRDVRPNTDGCEECLKTGDSWVHLRLCLSCGHVGCCDQSKNRHATKHFHDTQHPLIQSDEEGEDWLWCYVDGLWMEPA